MQSKANSLIDLELEDFHRLGVRPHEMRLTVIRRAASKTSRALAESQLKEPSATAALQLSRVTTSAYRLLDPRNRGDVQQRIHIGRILPTVLMWAGQTKFQYQQGGIRKEAIGGIRISGESNAASPDSGMPFQGGGLSEADLIELMELDSTPLLAGQPTWAQSLTDGELLGRSSLARRWNHLKKHLSNRWAVLGGGGLILALLLGLILNWSGQDSTVNEAADQIVAADVVSMDRKQRLSRVSDPSTNPVLDQRQEVARGTEPDSVNDLVLESFNPSGMDRPSLLDAISLDDATDTMFDLQSPVVVSPTTTPLSVDQVVRVPSSVNNGLGLSASGFLPDPFATGSAVTDFDSEHRDKVVGDSSVSGMDSPNSGQADTQGKPVIEGTETQGDVTAGRIQQQLPTAKAVREARMHILLVDPALMQPITIERISERLIQLDRIRQNFEPDSAEYWTASLMLEETAWLTVDAAEVGYWFSDLRLHFEFAPYSVLAETFLKANNPSSLPEIQMRLLTNGLVLIDRLITAEEFQLATQVLESVEPLTGVLQDRVAAAFLKDYSRTIMQSERMRDNSKRLFASDPATWSKANTGLLGRYYCLLLRRWDQGLIWLCDASDSRIASAARQELSLAADTSVEDLLVVSRRWSLNASRSSGSGEHSMRLHAIELMRRAIKIAPEFQRLEMDPELQAMVKSLPAYMQGMAWENVDDQTP